MEPAASIGTSRDATPGTPPLLCSHVQLVKRSGAAEDIKPLPCRSWGCDYCAPQRRAKLKAQAASGEPNKFLTLTVSPHTGTSPTDRRRMLHDAWKKLVKRILRQFMLTPERRWTLTKSEREPDIERRVRHATAETPQRGCDQLHYMAFIEKTKLGEPHLHILLRCPFLPQDWISEQMGELLGSPICDIRKIENTKHAIRYVTKYVGKAPAQFGSLKRYWISKHYELNKGEPEEHEHIDWRTTDVVRRRWSEMMTTRVAARYQWSDIGDGWYRFWKPGTWGSWTGLGPNPEPEQRVETT